MINRIKYITIVLLLLFSGAAFAGAVEGDKEGTELGMTNAASPRIEMADGLYQSGKIYVVVIVLSVIMLGIIAYLIMLDRKISKLEKEINNK